jgi:hypothetical protein
MSRRLAITHILLGLLGLLCCIVMFIRFAQPMRMAVTQLDELAESTQAELELTISMATEGEQVLNSFQMAAEANRHALREGDRSLDEVCKNFNDWQLQLERLSGTVAEAGRVSANFAEVLPLELPVLTYRMEKLRYGIPSVVLTDQIVELPYPTAKLGAKKETVDLGFTEMSFNVPTIELGTAQRKITLPANPEVSIENREFNVPSDFKIDKQSLLAQEKLVLQRVSVDLRNTAANLSESASAIDRLEKLANNELRDSLSASEAAMTQSIDQLEGLKSIRLPEFQSRLEDQHRQLEQSRPVFRELGQAIPWVFALFSLLPIGMVMQGLWMLSRS